MTLWELVRRRPDLAGVVGRVAAAPGTVSPPVIPVPTTVSRPLLIPRVATKDLAQPLANFTEVVAIIFNSMILNGTIVRAAIDNWVIPFSPREVEDADAFNGELYLATDGNLHYKHDDGTIVIFDTGGDIDGGTY